MLQKIFRSLLVFILICLTQDIYGQLSGSYLIPAQFPTIRAAVDSLDQVGPGAGGVTFNIAGGYSESITAPIIITAAGAAGNLITFQKSGGGANPLITRTDAGTLATSVQGGAGDAVIRVEGTDYLTFNSIDISANNSGIEYGFLTHKPDGTNGSKNITISNCTVTMTKGTSAYVAGIYIGNGTTSESSSIGVTVTSAQGINSNILIIGNTIQNVHSGILSIGSSAAGFYDNDIIIGQSGAGNTIQNFGGGSLGASNGVYFQYVNNPTSSYNIINNEGGGGTAATDSLFGVRHQVVSGNIISNNNAFTVNNISTRVTSVIHNSNNTVISETYNSNTFAGTLSTGILHLIYTFSNNTPDKTASGNVITGISKTGGSINGYYSATSFVTGGTETITNNNFSNINISGGSGTVALIYGAGTITHNFVVSNNIISNFIYNGSATINAINISTSNNVQIDNNTIFNISTGGSLTGINFTGINASVYNNKIYGLTSNTTGFNVVYGISTGSINNNATTYNIYNNFIYDLKSPGSKSFLGTAGINSNSGTNLNLFYNTIYLKFTSVEPTNKSAALGLGDTDPNVDMRNNIFVNDADVTTGLLACAIIKSSNWLLNISANTNNNLYYAGTPSAKHLIFYDGTNSDSTLLQYKNRVAPRESNSVTENPPFVNIAGVPYDLHINPLIATQVESGGLPISSPIAITTDFDGNTRNSITPDIGADEFSGIPADRAAPVIVYSPLLNTSSTSVRTLVVSVTDAGSGVPTTAPGWPNLYWKKNTGGTWTAVTPSGAAGNIFTFNFGSGTVLNDTVYYYIAAQDLAAPPNVGTNPSIGSGGFTVNPPAASIPPTTPSRYIITNTPLAGNYTIGTGGNYSTITAAVTDLNLRGVSSAVNFLLTDAVYTLETFPIVIGVANVSKPTSVNSVTIKPNTGVIANIQGAPFQSFIFKILESYVIIDGSNAGGSDRSLTIRNTSSNLPSAVWFGSIGTTPIVGSSLKNCNVINGANYSAPNYSVLISDGENAGISGYFNNITIQNNFIQKSWDAIYCKAVVSAGNGNGLLITGNIINSTSTNAVHDIGIYVGGVDGAVISSNQVGNLGGADAGGVIGISVGTGTMNSTISNNIVGPFGETGGGGVPRGISVSSGVSNSNITISGNEVFGIITSYGGAATAVYVYSGTTGVVIEKNKVYDIVNSNTFGFGARGIIINTNVTASDILIKNNAVWNVKCSGKQFPGTWGVGIGVDGSTGGIKVYHNSVNLYGTVATDSAGINTAFGVLSTEVSGLDVRDNIFVNKFENTLAATDKNYAINSLAPASAFTNINYNDYYVQGTSGILGYLGTDRTTLAAWQTATGQDANSISGSPGFISNTNLHINPDSNFVSNNGFYLADVTSDIDGDIRNNPPDIGADEYTISASNFQLTVNVTNGWNMVSIPGLLPTNQNVATWWPGKDPAAGVFKFLSGYTAVTTAVPGTGYWMKNSGAQTYNTGDEWPAGGIMIVPHDPISGAAGWNLIGGYEQSVATAGITTIPGGLITGSVYKYAGGYVAATTLDPGYGYWIKLTGAGSINIPSSFAGQMKAVSTSTTDFGKITITDNAQKSYILYAVQGEADLSAGVDLTQFDLPPYPPQGMFDVRYASQRYAERLSSTTQAIEMMGVKYPVKVKAEGVGIILSDENGKEIIRLKTGEEVILNTISEKLYVSENMVPSVFSLEQNYPNPFNPSTKIEFSLPENAANVKLSIYNALGEKVTELVNTSLSAGKYSYQWNAKDFATGMYIYELKADKFVSIKKMILIK